MGDGWPAEGPRVAEGARRGRAGSASSPARPPPPGAAAPRSGAPVFLPAMHAAAARLEALAARPRGAGRLARWEVGVRDLGRGSPRGAPPPPRWWWSWSQPRSRSRGLNRLGHLGHLGLVVGVVEAGPEGSHSLPVPIHLERHPEALDLRPRPRELGVVRPSLGPVGYTPSKST